MTNIASSVERNDPVSDDCTVCPVCDQPGSFESATEVARVPCHVRCFQDDYFTVWRCTNCGSLHSKENADLPKYYSRYPFKDHKLDYFASRAYANRLRLLRKVGVRNDSRILDYGCGSGVFIDFLARRGFSNLHGFDAFIPRFADPSVLSTKFDVVTSYDVIEHVSDPREYLKQLVDALADGGLLILGTPNADGIRLSPKPPFPVELSQPYHRHIFSERQLFSLAREHGLTPVYVYRRFYFDTWWPFVNTRFLWSYVQATGGFIDVCVKPLQLGIVARSPRLILNALLGYFAKERGNILVTFKKKDATRL
jgi:SAM-dependent methyltransferase